MMSTSSSTESTPPKVPDQVVVNTSTPANAGGRVGQAKQNSSDSDTREEDSTKVDDPVKAFQEDLQMEGYTGKYFLYITYGNYFTYLVRVSSSFLFLKKWFLTVVIVLYTFKTFPKKHWDIGCT